MSTRGPSKEKLTEEQIKKEEKKQTQAKKRKQKLPLLESYDAESEEEKEVEENLEQKKEKGFLLLTPEKEKAESSRKAEEKRQFALRDMHEKTKKLQEIFATTFPEKKWKRSEKEDGRIVYEHLTKTDYKITVEREKEDIKFSGTPIKKLIKATEAFEEKLPGMTYEVEAEGFEDAVAFMKDLHLNGFDLKKITAIKSMDGKELTKEGKKINLKEIIAQIQSIKPPEPESKMPGLRKSSSTSKE